MAKKRPAKRAAKRRAAKPAAVAPAKVEAKAKPEPESKPVESVEAVEPRAAPKAESVADPRDARIAELEQRNAFLEDQYAYFLRKAAPRIPPAISGLDTMNARPGMPAGESSGG